MDDEDMKNNLRVASFSCYLNSTNEDFALKRTWGLPDSSYSIISPEETPGFINMGRSKNNDPENGRFGANKHFNIQKDHPNSSEYGHKKERSVGLHQQALNVRPKTPSITSEVSSWNSQSVLLQSLHRKPSYAKNRKGVEMRLSPIFGCEGPCLDKKGVNINGTVDPGVAHEIKQSQPGAKKVEQFSFPALSMELKNMSVRKHYAEKDVVQEFLRNSIEVFGSAMTSKKGDISANLERKLSILTWDAIPNSQSLVATSLRSSAFCDDNTSDASSDLFEIENITSTGYPALSRQDSCNMSSCMSPTTQYGPSEASIEWSVVTASAADFASVVSEYEGKSVSIAGDIISGTESYRTANPSKVSVTKDVPKSGPSRLLGCRSYKAVKVVESAYRTNDKAKRRNKASIHHPK